LAVEIERKFLVTGAGWREAVSRVRDIRQVYLARTDAATVRVRIEDDRRATLTVKGNRAGATRAEFEWEISVEDARAMAQMGQGRQIRKRRHEVVSGGLTWEVDTFEDGLILAEIELPGENAAFHRPDWLGAEVTDDPAYYNAAMALD